MTTHEQIRMMELAAKAAGVNLERWNDGQGPFRVGPGFSLETGRIWNPADNDGDSRRLEVKLKINHRQYSNIVNIRGVWAHNGYVEATKKDIQEREPINGDPCAATRLAVLRAAASIGESVP